MLENTVNAVEELKHLMSLEAKKEELSRKGELKRENRKLKKKPTNREW